MRSATTVTPRGNQKKTQQQQKDMEYQDKLKLLDEELLSFYHYCQQVGFSEAEMDMIVAPLVATLRKSLMKKLAKIFGVVLSIVALGYCAAQLGSVSMHFAALGRLFMIKLLPFWDWTSMFYESCLVSNPFYGEYTLTEEDCVSCEALEHVDRLGGVAYEQLLDGYLNRDAPLIVVDAMESWPVMNTDDFWFDNITQLYLQDEKLMDTVPCILTTNLRTGSSDLHAFLKRIHSPKVDKWFVHWQNCDINAVKALRKFYQRPYFLSSSVSPAHFNWVLMSSDYNTKIYKKVSNLGQRVERFRSETERALMSRCLGHRNFNLHCIPFSVVFTNFMWTFEYFPGWNLDNVAILTETVWEEGSV
ncbi:hypothetical protein C0J52_00007 [Blattella germanica]|nr:hypothetical protein C0J52_00007 [Blattella germanica]